MDGSLRSVIDIPLYLFTASAGLCTRGRFGFSVQSCCLLLPIPASAKGVHLRLHLKFKDPNLMRGRV